MDRHVIIVLFINLMAVQHAFCKNVATTNKCKDSVELHGKHHKKHVLARNIDRPYELAYYNHSHKLFFSYNLEEEAEDTFVLAYLDTSNSSKRREVNGVKNGFATAVDERGRAVYFGGSEGVYECHPDANNTGVTRILSQVNVWHMFYAKTELYYVTYPGQRLYRLDVRNNDTKPIRVKSVHEEIYQFAIDGEHDMFFTNDSGAYRIKNGTEDRLHYRGETKFRAIAVDRKGEVHFGGKHGIYVVHEGKHNRTLREIARIRNLFGLTFDEHNNIIYADYHEIVKILPDTCDK